jgi:hypothetical protein
LPVVDAIVVVVVVFVGRITVDDETIQLQHINRIIRHRWVDDVNEMKKWMNERMKNTPSVVYDDHELSMEYT